MVKNLAIIPARGGSKRIPGKNIRNFLGKPIIAYSIEAAKLSGLFDTIIVSTDDKNIAYIAQKYGADIPFLRSSKNADDFTPVSEVLVEVLQEYRKTGVEFDNICCIYPTAPFTTSKLLIETYNILKHHNAVIPVVKYPTPIQRALRINKSGRLEFIQPEFLNSRSQDLEPAYYDAGQFFWIKNEIILKYKTAFVPDTGTIILPETHIQDIDTEEDWRFAEIKYRILQGE